MLAKTVESLGLRVYSRFPSTNTAQDAEFPSISQGILKCILHDPQKAINDVVTNHVEAFVDCLLKYDFVCDGWFALLPLATPSFKKSRMLQLIEEFSSPLLELSVM
jgi:hypothetical protein